MNRRASPAFLELILLVIVALVIIFLLGLQPSDLWSKVFEPVLVKLWNVTVAIAKAIAIAIQQSSSQSSS